MVATSHHITPTGSRILSEMHSQRAKGVDGMNKYALAECAKADQRTVHSLLRGFMDGGWVTAERSVDPDTCVPHATIYCLTESAPSLDDLLGLEE